MTPILSAPISATSIVHAPPTPPKPLIPAQPVPPITSAIDFLRRVWPNAPSGAYLTMWEKNSRWSDHVKVGDHAALEENLDDLDRKKKCAYYSVALRGRDLGQYKCGKIKDCVALPGLWLDIDIAGPGHAAKNLPPNEASVFSFLDEIGVEPTITIGTGGGLHLLFLFPGCRLIRPDESRGLNAVSREFQKIFIHEAGKRGWHMDQTGNLNRVLRWPFSTNFKVVDNPRPVQILDAEGPRYLSHDLFNWANESKISRRRGGRR